MKAETKKITVLEFTHKSTLSCF